MNKSFFNRRYFVISLATAVASVHGNSAWAATAEDAELLVGRVVREINAVISSGNSEAIMLKQFEKIFKSYADVKTIARYALGNDARALNKVQMDRFTEIYSVYVSHKYGRRFREFIGGKIVVQKSRPIKSFFEVETLAHIKGWEPFTVSFLVSNKSGKLLFSIFLLKELTCFYPREQKSEQCWINVEEILKK